MVNHKEMELEGFKYSQPIYVVKTEVVCSKGVAEQTLDKEILGAVNGFNQPSQQGPGIERGLYQQRHCQLN